MLSQPYYGDTIIAPATPPGQSGLAVIRLSGPRAISLVDKLFLPKRGHSKLSEMAGYRLAPGDFAGLDEVVVNLFRAPNSFTGEDVVEVSCHGGSAIKRAILSSLIEAGAVLAEPGEFSRRAFMNGKIDLVQAEAIMDLIGSEASHQVDAAYAQLKGHLSSHFRDAATRLFKAMASVELILEFPEHELHADATDQLSEKLAGLAEDLDHLSSTYERGRLIHDGARVVIYGQPNVGKSSLLNAFIGQNRAIVTDIPGTTRDTIEHHLDLHGYKVVLVDTAGVRKTADLVEQEGVRRSEAAVASADIVLALFAQKPQDVDLKALADLQAKGKAIILIRSKDDLAERESEHAFTDAIMSDLCKRLPHTRLIAYSAFRSEDQVLLADAIGELLDESEAAGSGNLWITNIRHKHVLDDVAKEIEEAAADVKAGQTFDLVAVRLRSAADRLAELTGDHVSETLVDTIFASFCVGK